jgi:hypothetical protein
MAAPLIPALALGLTGGLAGCAGPEGAAFVPGFRPDYRGVETRLLDGDLVNFHVTMRGARDASDVEAYAECAAAQYTLIRGYGTGRAMRFIRSPSRCLGG